ncbi:MAG TPA: helix-turn-helix domain-containing protein, partial [Candidatus Saccharimonadales bacterium]|nr:helix-turn-helix domain-containing protein [Candidatus Saccharimonadales bacterium]
MIKVSEFFKEERLRKGLTIDQVAKATKIRPAFLTAIENGEYHKLPSSAYATGFVRNYAQFLGLSQNRMLALFRREYAGEKTTAVLPAGFSSSSDFPGRFFKLQQKIGLAALLFLAIF